MLEIFRFNGKWRLKIINETFEFKDLKDLKENLKKILDQKNNYEPYSFEEKKNEGINKESQ